MKTTGEVTTETMTVTITTTEDITTSGNVTKRAEIQAHIDNPITGITGTTTLDTDRFIEWLNEYKIIKEV